MFCKWCGGNLNSGDTKCKRCGKDAAVMSDCGGFYDIVKGQQAAQPQAVVVQQKEKTPVALMVGVIAGFAVVLGLLIYTFAMQMKLTQEVENLRSEIQELHEVAEEETVETQGETESVNITLPDLFGDNKEESAETAAPEV